MGAKMGRKLGWAALAAAGMLAFAGQAGATIVDVAISAEFYSLSGPAGFYPASGPCNQFSNYCTGTSGGTENVSFNVGGIPFTANFSFDTDLATLATTATGQSLLWDVSSGTPSPLLSGEFVFWPNHNPPLVDRDLSTATHFTMQRDQAGYFAFFISGPGFSFSQTLSNIPVLGGSTIDTPSSLAFCTCGGVGYYGDGYSTYLSEVFSETITARAVPEPSTWAFLVLGFAGVGAAVRRRHTLAPAA